MKAIGVIGMALAGCGGGSSAGIDSMTAQLSENVATVIEVTWELEAEGDAYIEYGLDGACEGMQTPSFSGATGDTLILGVPPVTDVCFSLVATIDGDEAVSEVQTIRTGNLPSIFSSMTVEEYDADRVADGFVIGSNAIDPAMLYVLNRDGEIVWYLEPVNEFLRPQMILARDGKSFIFNEFSKDFTEDSSSVYRVSFDGEILEQIPTPDGHHAFQELPDGTIVSIAIDVRDTEEYGPVVGDSIVEIPPDGGDPVVVYTVWDDDSIPLEPHNDWNSEFYPHGKDWTHANYVHYNEERDTYTISYRNVSTIVELERATGEVIRSVGRHGTHETDTTLVNHPHGGYWTDDDTLMFLTTPIGAQESWGAEMQFDDEAMTADIIWAYGDGQGHKSLILGEALRLENDNTLVNFGSTGRLIEVTPGGDVVWSLFTSLGTFPGHTTILKDFYGAWR